MSPGAGQLCDCSPLPPPTGSHRLPALPHHHADPDPGPDTVCAATLPNCRGTGCGEPGPHAPPLLPVLPSTAITHTSLPQKDLLGVQQLLNSSETSLHQLTAMLDCRGLHKVRRGDTATGVCSSWGYPPPSPALPHPVSRCRTTWTPSSVSATTGWRVCSTWCSSPCWWPPPSPPSSVPHRVPGSTLLAGGSAFTGGHRGCVHGMGAGHGGEELPLGPGWVSAGTLSPQGPGL